MKKFFALMLLLGAVAVTPYDRAHADDHATCYRLQKQDTPEAAVPTQGRTEIWCYQNLAYPAGSVFIYNADGEEALPETSMVLSADGIITHASLAAGELSFHRVPAKQLNPLSIPLTEPRSDQMAAPNEVHASPESAQKVLKTLLQVRSATFQSLSVSPGRYVASVPPERMPWRGYWWAYAGQPLSGFAYSPLDKYDRFVQARSGVNPGSAAWENYYHRYRGINWEGHCNGWAASAILRREPNVVRRDAATGMNFSVDDQKGILSERDYCASTAFYGRRFNGYPGDDPSDIYPPLFHQVLVYYIGQLQKPIAMDYRSDPPVDNNIISGYQMDIVQSGPNTFTVTVNLTMHKYDSNLNYPPGVAPIYHRTYRYALVQDASGNIVQSQWLSTNPDFLWVPLGSPKCNAQNPRIDESWTQQILNLPPAQ